MSREMKNMKTTSTLSVEQRDRFLNMRNNREHIILKVWRSRSMWCHISEVIALGSIFAYLFIALSLLT